MTNLLRLSHRRILSVVLGLVAIPLAAPACASSASVGGDAVETEGALGGTTTSEADLDPIVDVPAGADGIGAVKDEAPITKAPRMDYSAQAPPADPRFAAATVLAGLRRLRRYYHSQPYEPLKGDRIFVAAPNAVGVTLASVATMGSSNWADFDTMADAWNTSGDGMDGRNLTSMPTFWSDVQAHFYVIPPHRRHGCWTMALNAMKSGCNPFPGKPMREQIRMICSGQQPMEDSITALPNCSTLDKGIAVIPAQMSAFNLLWVDPATRKFISLPDDVRRDIVAVTAASAVKNLKSVKWSEEQRAKGYVNVWEYIMLSDLWAFDWNQQQAVLNAYYGDNKHYDRFTAAGGSSPNPDATVPFNPKDTTDCMKWRPSRPGDPSDGTQCLATKVHRFWPIGR